MPVSADASITLPVILEIADAHHPPYRVDAGSLLSATFTEDVILFRRTAAAPLVFAASLISFDEISVITDPLA